MQVSRPKGGWRPNGQAPAWWQGVRRRWLLIVPISLLLIGLATAVALQATGLPRAEPPQKFEVSRGDVKVDSGRLVARAEFLPDSSANYRAFVFLSPPEEPRPWQDYSYQASVQEVFARNSVRTTLTWDEPLAIPGGTYRVTIWFHRIAPDGTGEHVFGDVLGKGQVTVEGAPVGPQLFFGGAAAQLQLLGIQQTGAAIAARLEVKPASGVAPAIRWELRPAGNKNPNSTVYYGLAMGAQPATSTVELRDDLSLPAGLYDLWVYAEDPAGIIITQALRVPRAFEQAVSAEFYRPAGVAGPWRIRPPASPLALGTGENSIQWSVTPIAETRAECRMDWIVRAQAGEVASGNASCEGGILFLNRPAPGEYQLELSAVATLGANKQLADRILMPVTIKE